MEAKQWLVSKPPAWPPSSSSRAGSPRAPSRVRDGGDQTASSAAKLRLQSCALSRSFRFVLRCERLSQKGVMRLCGEMILVFISSPEFSPSWDPTARVIPMRMNHLRRWPQDVARPSLVPKQGQNPEEERKPGKKKRVFQMDHACANAAAELEEPGGEPWPRPGTPPAGGRRDAGRVRGAAPTPAAAAAMPILVKAAAGAGTRHRRSSISSRDRLRFSRRAPVGWPSLCPPQPPLLPQTLASAARAPRQGRAR